MNENLNRAPKKADPREKQKLAFENLKEKAMKDAHAMAKRFFEQRTTEIKLNRSYSKKEVAFIFDLR